MSARARLSSHNILFRLNRKKWKHDLGISTNKIDLSGLQEVSSLRAKATVKLYTAKHEFGTYGLRTSTPIIHRRNTWKPVRGARGIITAHGPAGFMELNPARTIVYRGFSHRETGHRIMVIVVHPTAGYAKPEPNAWGPKANDWKDDTAKIYWRRVVNLTERFERSGKWDAIVILGDFNARLNNRREPFFPGVVLAPYYRTGAEIALMPNSIDYIVETKKSKVRRVRRYKQFKGVFTDHPIQFSVLEFTEPPIRPLDGA